MCPFSQVLHSTGPKTHCVMRALFVMRKYCNVTIVGLAEHIKATKMKTFTHFQAIQDEDAFVS